MDDDGSKSLDFDEFKKGLREAGATSLTPDVSCIIEPLIVCIINH